MTSEHAAPDASAARDDEGPARLVEILEGRHSRQVSVVRMDFSMQEDVLAMRIVAEICVDGHHVDAFTMLDSQRFFGVSLPACEVGGLVHVQPYA